MKTLIKIAIIVLFTNCLYSQNSEPGKFEFTYGTHSNAQEFNPDDFLQTRILFGFQWGASYNMNDALGNLCSSLYLSNKYYDEYRKVLCSILLTNYKENL